MQSLHADVAGSDPKDKKWETYCKTIKPKAESNNSTEESSTPKLKPRKAKRTKRTAFLETSGEAESFPHDDSHVHITEVHNRIPMLTNIKEDPLLQDETAKNLTDGHPLDKGMKAKVRLEHMKEIDNKVFEERTKSLPTIPLNSAKFCHVHCDYCGHPTIVHGNHIDYVCEGELHFVSYTGDVYPHKLEVSNINPIKCKFQNTEEVPHNNSISTMPHHKQTREEDIERFNKVEIDIDEVLSLLNT